MQPYISMIAALATANNAIGKDGSVPWKIPADMKHFRDLTQGHPVIMGRKTWESIPERFRPLPDRSNIVLTRQRDFAAPGARVVNELGLAIDFASELPGGGEEIFIIGGGEIYEQALPYAERLYLTLVDMEVEGDAFFPKYAHVFTRIAALEEHKESDPPYAYLTLER